MFIWTKRQFVQEMLRVVDEGRNGEAAAITHTHNQPQWSRPLVNHCPGRLSRFVRDDAGRPLQRVELFADVMRGGPLDLSRRDSQESIDADPP
jgi:hypothetical protein